MHAMTISVLSVLTEAEEKTEHIIPCKQPEFCSVVFIYCLLNCILSIQKKSAKIRVV